MKPYRTGTIPNLSITSYDIKYIRLGNNIKSLYAKCKHTSRHPFRISTVEEEKKKNLARQRRQKRHIILKKSILQGLLQ